MLAITFTNKAAGELKERLKAMLGDTMGGDVFASTFHSACVRILRRDAERIGFPKSFTIYDSDDQQRVIKQIYKELMIDDKFLPVKSAISQISGYKDKLLSAKDVAAEAPRDTKAALISKIYTAYSNRLRTAGAMDFDDLIFHTRADAENRCRSAGILPAEVPLCRGGRIPGYQRGPVPPGAPAGRWFQQCMRCWR